MLLATFIHIFGESFGCFGCSIQTLIINNVPNNVPIIDQIS